MDEVEFLKTVDRFCRERLPAEAIKIDIADSFPMELAMEMGRLNLMGLQVPVKYSGAALSTASYSRVLGMIASYSISIAVIVSVHNSVAISPILQFGTEEQKAKYLPEMAKGIRIGSFALTEPSAGSDASTIITAYSASGDRYALNGSKLWITNGSASSVFIVFAKDAGTEQRRISAFIVTRPRDGFTVARKEEKLGLNGSDSVMLSFDNCIVGREDLLGEEGKGFTIAMKTLDSARIGIASISVGAIYGILRHLMESNVSGRSGYTAITSNIAKWYEMSRQYLEYLSAKKDGGGEITVEASIAKSYASEHAFRAADLASSLLYEELTDQHSYISRMLRDTKVLSIVEGTNEIQDMIIAKRYRL